MIKKDIFGNVYEVPTNKSMSFAQKYKEAKAKEQYKKYMAEQRAQQINKLKTSAQRSKQGLQKISGLLKKGYGRATSKRLITPKEKITGSIYKK